MLESEPDRCYVCLEECDTRSPCECKMPVHERCLSEAHYVSQRKNCSICQSAIQVKNVHFFPIPPNVYRREPENQTANHIIAVACYLIFIYLVLGWIGKLIAYGLGFQINPEWGAFWKLDHFLSFICSFVFLTCVYNGARHAS